MFWAGYVERKRVFYNFILDFDTVDIDTWYIDDDDREKSKLKTKHKQYFSYSETINCMYNNRYLQRPICISQNYWNYTNKRL